MTLETWLGIAGFVTALAAVLVIPVDRELERRHERTRWRRDEQVDAFAEFVASYFTVWNRMRFLRPTTQLSVESLAEVRQSAESLKASLVQVQLMADSDVYLSAARVYSCLDVIVPSDMDASYTQLSDSEWNEAHRQAHALLIEFIEVARTSLGLPSHPTEAGRHPILWFGPDGNE